MGNQKQPGPFSRLWSLADGYHGGYYASVIAASVGVLSGMVPYYAGARIIVALISGSASVRFCIEWVLVALLCYVVKALLYGYALSVSHKATFTVIRKIRGMLLEKLPRLPLGRVYDSSSGELKQIIVDQTERIERPLAHLIPEMTSNLLVPLLIFIYMALIDWRMALLALVSLPVGLAVMMSVMKGYAADYAKSVETTGYMNSAITEYIGGIKVIKAFNQGSRSYEKYSSSITANASFFFNWMKKCQMPVSLSRAISPATLITVLPCGWLFYLSGSLSMPDFIMIITLSLGLAGPLLAAMDFVDELARVGTVVSNIDSILNAPEQVHPKGTVQLSSTDISLDKVSFSYHEGEKVLDDISLKIPQGSLTALVGPSGSGKTTIARLIAGFWDVTDGSLSMGGVDYRYIPLDELYSKVAFVSQENYLFDETIRENIRLGRPSATDAEVEEVARKAGCAEFISALEKGFDTVAGSGGAHLSGGERQRISIARAMLKNAPVLILDEATAYMDPENERIMQEAVSELAKDKTVIVIAHRLSTITTADQILVIDKGRICEQGRHKELVAAGGLYSSMWKAHMSAKDGE